MAALALERVVLARDRVAAQLVRVVVAVVSMVTPPMAGYTFTIAATPEFGLGTISGIVALAQVGRLVRVVAAVVLEVAQPPLGQAPVILAPEFGGIAPRAVLRQLVRTIMTVVLAVTEQPLGYALVVGEPRAPLPADGTVAVSAKVCGLVRIVATVVVEVAHQHFVYAATVLACELGIWVASLVICGESRKNNNYYNNIHDLEIVRLIEKWNRNENVEVDEGTD